MAEGTLCLLAYAVGQWEGYQPARHHKAIARALERVAAGQCKRLMIFMPPRHGKSMLASEYFPAWWLGRNPGKSVIAASYAQGLADDFGRKVRNLMLSDAHSAMFPGGGLRKDSTSASRFHTLAGGAYIASGAQGTITGRGADLLLIDDPLSGRADAESELVRRRLQDWYSSVARTRLAPGGAIIIIQTRWHEADLAGWLLDHHAHEGWEVLSLPAIAEEGDALGRAPGAALWPDRYPLDELESLRSALSSRDWAALYQQRPTPPDGGEIKLRWFRRYAAPPKEFRRIVQSWDTAYRDGSGNDPSACTTWGEAEDGYYLLHVLRARMEYPEFRASVVRHREAWGASLVLVEDSAAGIPVVQDLQALHLPLVPIRPQGSKVARARACAGMIEAGHVRIPEWAEWLGDYEHEIASFPVGRHDDQVDSTVQALLYFQGGVEPKLLSFGIL